MAETTRQESAEVQRLSAARDRRGLLLFYEYFHCDNGAGLRASHQTEWTGIVARMMHLFATTPAEQVLPIGKGAAVTEGRDAYAGVHHRAGQE